MVMMETDSLPTKDQPNQNQQNKQNADSGKKNTVMSINCYTQMLQVGNIFTKLFPLVHGK